MLDRIKRTLVSLRMPRALEMIEVTVRQLERGEVTPLEAIDTLLAEELTLRESRRIKTALVMARLATIKTLAGFDFAFQPSLDRNRVLTLAQLDFIDRHEVSTCSARRTGKSHLAIALGVEAVKAGRSVYFITLADLVGALAKAEREGRLHDKIRFFGRAALLIVDEIGYLSPNTSAPKPSSRRRCRDHRRTAAVVHPKTEIPLTPRADHPCPHLGKFTSALLRKVQSALTDYPEPKPSRTPIRSAPAAQSPTCAYPL